MKKKVRQDRSGRVGGGASIGRAQPFLWRTFTIRMLFTGDEFRDLDRVRGFENARNAAMAASIASRVIDRRVCLGVDVIDEVTGLIRSQFGPSMHSDDPEDKVVSSAAAFARKPLGGL